MWAMIVKEFRQLRRDRRTLAMMIVMPVILLIVFGYAASFDVSTIPAVVAGPKAVTRPTTSWPRMAGYCEMPQSLFNTETSEWQSPQCSTATSTSSIPSGPRSMSWRTSTVPKDFEMPRSVTSGMAI